MPQADAAAMIRDLQAAGLSRPEIAATVGVSRATVWRLANDANRDHMAATVQRVEKLHGKIVGGAGDSRQTARAVERAACLLPTTRANSP